MKTIQVFLMSAVIISGAFFGVLSMFELPQSTTEWVVSDAILGVVLYLSYLVIATSGPSKAKARYSLKKATA